jgi:hypothetical protein
VLADMSPRLSNCKLEIIAISSYELFVPIYVLFLLRSELHMIIFTIMKEENLHFLSKASLS